MRGGGEPIIPLASPPRRASIPTNRSSSCFPNAVLPRLPFVITENAIRSPDAAVTYPERLLTLVSVPVFARRFAPESSPGNRRFRVPLSPGPASPSRNGAARAESRSIATSQATSERAVARF